MVPEKSFSSGFPVWILGESRGQRLASACMPSMRIQAAATLEKLVNAYIYRALLSPEHLEEVTVAFGGLNLHSSATGALDPVRLAHSIAGKILGPGWHYEVVEDAPAGLPRVRIAIIGRS